MSCTGFFLVSPCGEKFTLIIFFNKKNACHNLQ